VVSVLVAGSVLPAVAAPEPLQAVRQLTASITAIVFANTFLLIPNTSLFDLKQQVLTDIFFDSRLHFHHP
jgi:hypothetical protein